MCYKYRLRVRRYEKVGSALQPALKGQRPKKDKGSVSKHAAVCNTLGVSVDDDNGLETLA